MCSVPFLDQEHVNFKGAEDTFQCDWTAHVPRHGVTFAKQEEEGMTHRWRIPRSHRNEISTLLNEANRLNTSTRDSLV